MHRTIFRIDNDVQRRLRRIAAARGVSMATIIRKAIDEKVERLAPKPRSLGVGASGLTDTAGRSADERPGPRPWRRSSRLPPYASLDRSDADHA